MSAFTEWNVRVDLVRGEPWSTYPVRSFSLGHCARANLCITRLVRRKIRITTRPAALLIKEALGVEGARRRSNAGQNRQGKKC